jgi:ADP-ribose pyrophosphatase YjhB (NUDIX family)
MIDDPIQFCPRCGTRLIEKSHSGRIRPACPNCEWVYFPDPKVAVAVLIKNGDKVLLAQRRYDPQKGYWTLPSGFVDAGEDPLQAARRECLEETGLILKDLSLVDVLYSREHPRGASIIIIYRATVQSGELRAGDDAMNVAYFHIGQLPKLAFLSTQKILHSFF